ncbi:MAG: tetratricopeptide repeat protein, partial [Deltaproteobacteria bacterium]|nr:tetratricopeptide repeat protein [Deltaproteobacteria bacterium]
MTRKIKYTRKDLKSPDEFISTLSRTTLWMKENRSTVLVALAAILLVFGGVFGTLSYIRWQETKAARDLWPHMNRAREALQAPAAPDNEKLEQIEQSLSTQVSKYPDTKAARFATYYLGSIAYRRGDYDRSAEQFRSAIAQGKGQGTIMDFLLREGLAQALEAKGDLDGAQKTYAEAVAFAHGELRTQAWMGQARTLSIQGRKEEAETVFRKILAENPDT